MINHSKRDLKQWSIGSVSSRFLYPQPICLCNRSHSMRTTQKHLFFSILFFFVTQISFAQRPADFELWVGGELGFRLNKQLAVSLSEQVRFDDTISAIKKSFTEIGLKYKIGKGFSLKGNYRFIIPPGQNVLHRIALDGNYRWKKKGAPLSISYRLRYQHQFGKKRTYIRNKVKFGYNLTKLVDPFAAYEMFFRLNGKNEFRVSRLTVGLDWKITKKIEFTTFYRLQDDIFIKVPERQHVLGIILSYKLKAKKTPARAD